MASYLTALGQTQETAENRSDQVPAVWTGVGLNTNLPEYQFFLFCNPFC